MIMGGCLLLTCLSRLFEFHGFQRLFRGDDFPERSCFAKGTCLRCNCTARHRADHLTYRERQTRAFRRSAICSRATLRSGSDSDATQSEGTMIE